MTEQEAIKEIRSCLGVNNIIMPYSDEMVAFGMAIEALEKQIPKKLELTKVRKKCSNCNHIITDKNCTKLKIKYCYNCGQAIDWSEEE